MKSSIKILALLSFLIGIGIFVILLSYSLTIDSKTDIKTTEQTRALKVLEAYTKFYNMELIDSFSSTLINGVLTYSDDDFSKILEYYRILNISIDNYPNLNGIFFFRKMPICNGITDNENGIIYIYACDYNMSIRDYFITADDWELSTLAHEISHYKYYINNDSRWHENEDLQDDNAYIWTGKGIKLG